MLTTLWKALTLCALAGAAFAQDRTVLESYSFQLGTPSSPTVSAGAEVRFKDRFFGNGTAQSSIKLLEQSSSSTLENRPLLLMMEVKRTVQPDEMVFALLVFGVEIRGWDAAGTEIVSRDLPGFTFGDSASGTWYERIGALPTNLAKLSITFYGNYE